MSDLIERQDALRALSKEVCGDKIWALDARDAIVHLPSAEPEQKTGKWIVDDEYIDCSYCRREKWSRVPYEQLVSGFRFCPNCGARMEVEND